MFDFWPVYSGEQFRASWPSCFIFQEKKKNLIKQTIHIKYLALFSPKKKALPHLSAAILHSTLGLIHTYLSYTMFPNYSDATAIFVN